MAPTTVSQTHIALEYRKTLIFSSLKNLHLIKKLTL